MELYSVSKIKLFQSCPRKYFLHYIEHVPEPTISNSLILGTSVHQTIEKFTVSEGAIDPGKYFKDTYDSEKFKNEQSGKQVIYGDWDSYKDDIARGQEMVEQFLRKSVTHQSKKIFSEVPFAVRFMFEDGDFIVLVGVIDGVTEDMQVLEYKTTKADPQPFFIQNDMQLLLYAYALQYGLPVKNSNDLTMNSELKFLFGKMPKLVTYVALHSLCKNRKPWHVQQLYHELVPTAEKCAELKDTIRENVAIIRWCTEHNVWPKYLKDPSTGPCSSCAYKDVCWNTKKRGAKH